MNGVDDRRERRFERIFFRSAIPKALVERDGRFLEVNDAFHHLLGYPREELIGADFPGVSHPDDRDADAPQIARLLALEIDSYRTEKRYLHRDGRVIWADLSVTAVIEGGGVAFFIAQVQDITERKAAERALAREAAFRQALVDLHLRALGSGLAEDFYRHLMETAVRIVPGAQKGSLLLRDDGERFRFAAAVGYDLAELQTIHLLESELFRTNGAAAGLIREIDNSAVPEERLSVLERAGASAAIAVSLTVPILLGEHQIGRLSLDNFDDEDAFDEGAIEMTTLLGQQLATLWQRLELEADLRRQKEAFEHRALHDPLTGLPNRLLFDDRLRQALEQADRTGRSAALFFIDLDDFKAVNDTHGHRVGDALLCEIARRLRGCLRSSDTAARWGGDEFVVLLTNVKRPHDLDLFATRMLAALARPTEVDGVTLEPSISLGAALYPEAADAAEALMRQADAALYEMKNAGDGGVRIRVSRGDGSRPGGSGCYPGDSQTPEKGSSP